MPHTSCYIQVGTECLHYLKAGNGNRLLLAFHGYGLNAASLTLFEPYLSAEYTCLFFDLPHHGKSDWKNYSLFTTQNLSQLVQELMQVHGVNKISLLGYSIGGRVCFSIIHVLPVCIDKVTLLATDGLRIDPYYRFFTLNYSGKKIFNHLLTKPAPYHSIIKLLRKVKLVDESRYKFVMHYLDNEAGRNQLRKVWPSLTELVPPIAELKETIQRHKICITIFMGKYDRVIPPALAFKFKTGLDTVRVHILEKGHRLVDTQNVQSMAETLLH